MPRDITCDLDAFARSLEELIGDIPEAVQDKVNKAVGQSTRSGVKTVRRHASEHGWSDDYTKGFTSHVKNGMVAEGEIGNKSKPGLVHLLEKGHATITGRRTRAFPHMAPAFDEIQGDFIDRVDRAVGEALK